MQSFKLFLESDKSDGYERAVADYINSLKGITASRPNVGTAYSDVQLTLDNGESTWLEVKMNHTDNLSNPRIFFDGKKWDTTYKTPAAEFAVDMMNHSKQAAQFIKDIGEFAGIKKPIIPTTKSGLKDENAIPLEVMREYFNQPHVNRYIGLESNVDLGKVVTDHYINGKAEPAYYMQAGDDFYMISNKNPFKLSKKIPVLEGVGDFKVRISTRSEFYEVQAEIKIVKMPNSKFSLMPNTKKLNPFESL
jgi:hypothetical protein